MTTSHPFGFGSSPLSIHALSFLPGPQLITASWSACQRVNPVVARPPEQSVVLARVELVLDRLEAAVEGVGAGAAREKVGPRSADQEVVALITIECVLGPVLVGAFVGLVDHDGREFVAVDLVVAGAGVNLE